MPNERVYVTVIGSSGVIPERVRRLAERVGELLAKRGALVVTGGRDGVMEAVCRGAKRTGGTTVGILPGIDRREANEFVDIAIPTGLLHARNAVNVLAGDAVIVIAGGPGTLSEVGLAMAYGKPVVALKGSGGVADLVAGRSIGGRKVYEAETPEEAVEKALELV
ncbi:MAG: TIGR00725 family protein [Thermoprotei archaeon]|nr:MAG: TIGR00725 family protein [Thermoprotei archaeon]RLF02331.1 MAG: TIGR00725 family protein [Thermoprotei archaeon]